MFENIFEIFFNVPSQNVPASTTKLELTGRMNAFSSSASLTNTENQNQH